jgi:hypothetical protein
MSNDLTKLLGTSRRTYTGQQESTPFSKHPPDVTMPRLAQNKKRKTPKSQQQIW